MTATERIAGLTPKKGPLNERIDIVHHDLDRSDAEIPPGVPGTEALVIFWRGDIPAGHAYVMHDRTGRVPAIGLKRGLAPSRCVPEPAGRPVKKTLSVIICTRDRPGALWRCLQSLSQLNSPPDQILVVDNASRDDAAEDIARAFVVDYVREDCAGLDYARNRGVREARGEIVAFVDDDVVVHPAWTEQLLAAFDNAGVMAVTGLVLPAELETRAQIFFETQWGFGRGYARRDYGPDFLIASGKHPPPTWKIGAGANMAFRREIFDKAGYFDERLDAGAAGCGGDSEFWYRVLARGWCCRYEPAIVVFHYHRRSEQELARQIRAYMRGHVAALLVQHRRYHDRRNLWRIFATLPVWYSRKLLDRMRNGKTAANAFFWQEIRGALAGIGYGLSRPRSTQAFRRDWLPRAHDGMGEADAIAATGADRQDAGNDMVSVIVPAFNAAGTIAQTLCSICEQTYRNLDIIVVDDGSTDGTADIVREFTRMDPRVRLVSKPNGGVASARNLGVQEALGDYIAPIDADDLWQPTKIAKQMRAMHRMGEACGLVYTWYAQIDHAGRIVSRKHKPLDEGHALIRMCRGNVVGNGSGALMRKRAMLEAGLYDPALRSRGAQGCEDLKLYFAVAERYLFAVVKEHLTGYRRIDWNMSSDVLQMERSNTLVTAEFQGKYPQYDELFRVARISFLKWLLVRAVRLRKVQEAWILLRKIVVLNEVAAIKILLMLPVTLARGWAVPRIKWAVKWLLRWNTAPVYFLRPAAGPADAASSDTTAGNGRSAKSSSMQMGQAGKTSARAAWFASAKLRALRAEFGVVWDAAREHRWAGPVLVGLGLGASIAETLGISVVILFLYAVTGGTTGASASGGVLGHVFRLAHSLSGGSRLILAVLILAFVAGKGLFNLNYALLTARVKNAVNERMRNAVYQTYLEIPYGHLRSRDQGALLTTLATESWAVADAFYAFTRLATNLCAIGVFSAFLISIAYPIFLVAVVGLVLLYGASRHLTKPARALGEEILVAMRALTLQIVNTLQAMRTIRAFGAEEHMQDIFGQASARVRRVLIRTDRIYSITGPLHELGYFLLLGAIGWTAVLFDVPTASTLGAVALLYRLQPHIREFEANRIKLINMAPMLVAVDSVLKLRANIGPSSRGLRFSGLSRTIVFEQVSFSYPGAGEPALCQVQFSIPKGSRTVICGPSGAGKTTMVNLLLGLCEPSEGRILVDGMPLAELDRSDWRRAIALAGQDAELFEATVRDNIAIARPGASNADIIWAAGNAGIHDTISRLPQGYDTWIGERGLNLSGGQRQRIALARALLRKPAILILDEATNAVDVPLEAEIRRNVLDIMRDGTVIFITHRPDDVSGADHCIWLSAGQVQYEGEPLTSVRTPAPPGPVCIGLMDHGRHPQAGRRL